MRIAYLVNQYPKVSHTFIKREIQALERRGFEVARIALRGWSEQPISRSDCEEQERTRYVLREGAFRLLLSFTRVFVARPRKTIQAIVLAWRMSRKSERSLAIHLIYVVEASRILLWLREMRIQHVHAHFGTNSAEVAMLAHVLGGPQWSFTVHGPEEFDRAPLIGLAEKIRRCAFVVAISSYGRSQLYRQVPSDYWRKIKIVHCGLEADFHSEQPAPSPTTARLLSVGRLSEQKGQIILIEAARKLLDKGLAFELVLAGDGELRALIESLILRYGLAGHVRITGWISSDEVRKEMLAARALVLSSFAEGLPVVIMEAMSLRLPVIATFVAGIPELVIHGEHGWLVPAGDADALAVAMEDCLTVPTTTLTQLGSAARERVLERHNVDVEAEKLANLFESASASDANESRN
jgi:colanic acid/amylovoran biosynthesis glycosyltransferase